MTGRKPWSAPFVPLNGETPYSINPGRTQSPCESGKPISAAELARLRSPASERVAAANTINCSAVVGNSGKSADDRCVHRFTGPRRTGKALSAAYAA